MNYGLKDSSRWQGVGAVLLSAISFAFSSVVYKIAYRLGLPPAQVLGLHTWIAAAILLVGVTIFHREVFQQKARHLGTMVVISFIGKLGTNILVAYSLLFLPASIAILLLYLYAVFTVVAGVIFLHKKLEEKHIVALLIVISGAILASNIIQGIRKTSLIGVLLALGAAVCYTVYNLVGEVILTEVSPLALMSYTQWFSSLGIAVYLGKNTLYIPWASLIVWKIGLIMAIISSILPFYLVLYGIRRIGAGETSILSTFELPATFAISGFFLREIPNWNQILGGALVLMGVALLNFWKRNANRNLK